MSSIIIPLSVCCKRHTLRRYGSASLDGLASKDRFVFDHVGLGVSSSRPAPGCSSAGGANLQAGHRNCIQAVSDKST